jgi:hypothetical protein
MNFYSFFMPITSNITYPQDEVSAMDVIFIFALLLLLLLSVGLVQVLARLGERT